MNKKFRDTFENVRATDETKQNTLAFLRDKQRNQLKQRRFSLRHVAALCAAFVLVLGGTFAYSFYNSPVSYISVDVNPSIELSLNRINRVVSIKAFNEDGFVILENLNLKNKLYTDAIDIILGSHTISDYLAADALLTFTVVSDRKVEILTGIRECHSYANYDAEFHGANSEVVTEAHHRGISFGKYQAFLELSKYDKDITIEECKPLSMRQIRNMITEHGGEEHKGGNQGTQNGGGHGGNGNGNMNGHHGRRD